MASSSHKRQYADDSDDAVMPHGWTPHKIGRHEETHNNNDSTGNTLIIYHTLSYHIIDYH